MEAVVTGRNDAASAALPDTGLAELEAIASPSRDLARRDSLRRRLLAGADIGALLIAYVSVALATSPDQPTAAVGFAAAAVPGWILLNKLLGLYDRDAHLIHKSTLDEIPRLALSAILGTTLIFMFAPPIADVTPARAETIAFMVLAFVWLFALRGLVRNAVVRRTPPERCLIIGSGAVAGMVARKLQLHPEYGVSVAGFVDVKHADANGNGNGDGHANGGPASVPGELLGDLDDFEQICAEYNVDRVIIAFSLISHEGLIDVIRSSKRLALKVTVVPRLFEVIGHQVEVDQIEGITMLGLRGFGRTRSSLALKRAIDIAGAGVGLLLLSPVILVIALIVKLTSRGPVFYVHDRVGRANTHFRMLKFRTMVEGADDLKPHLEHLNEADGPMFKIADDPRVTPIGRVLRRTSLDELPQLINVLRGDMSLVGPRPLIPSEDVHVIGYHRERLDLTPGLTGPWQVLGRTAIPFQEMIKLDYLYVAEWSLWNDIKLLLRTAPTVVQGRGQ
jgi:exopolysaccharide biosynthesis polyprenyl glycosylphosphotransferase